MGLLSYQSPNLEFWSCTTLSLIVFLFDGTPWFSLTHSHGPWAKAQPTWWVAVQSLQVVLLLLLLLSSLWQQHPAGSTKWVCTAGAAGQWEAELYSKSRQAGGKEAVYTSSLLPPRPPPPPLLSSPTLRRAQQEGTKPATAGKLKQKGKSHSYYETFKDIFCCLETNENNFWRVNHKHFIISRCILWPWNSHIWIFQHDIVDVSTFQEWLRYHRTENKAWSKKENK